MNNFSDSLITEIQGRPILWSKWNKNYKNRILVDKEWSTVANILKKDKEEIKTKWRNLRDQYQRELKKVKHSRSGDPGSPTSRYTGKWVYFQALSFLRDSMMPRCTDSNFHNEHIEQETELEPSNHSTQVSQDLLTNEDLGFPVSTSDTPMPNYHNDPFQNDSESQASEQQLTEQLQHETPRHNNVDRISSRGKKRKTSKMTDFETEMLQLEQNKLALLTANEKNEDDDADGDLHFVKSLVPFLKMLNPIKKLLVRSEMQSLIYRELLDNNAGNNAGASSNSNNMSLN